MLKCAYLTVYYMGYSLYCGFKFAAARKADKIEEAKKQIVRLIVGIILSAVLGIVGGIALDLAKKNMIANLR